MLEDWEKELVDGTEARSTQVRAMMLAMWHALCEVSDVKTARRFADKFEEKLADIRKEEGR